MNAARKSQMEVLKHSASIGPKAGSTHVAIKGQARTPCGLSIVMLSSKSASRYVGTAPTCTVCAQRMGVQ